MATIYQANDHGEIFYSGTDGKVYQRVGNVTGVPIENTQPFSVGSVVSAGEFTYNNADINGRTSYSSAEMVLAENKYFKMFGGTSDYYEMYAGGAPVNGVLRWYGSTSTNPLSNVTELTINDVIIGKTGADGNYSMRQPVALSIRVYAGDNIVMRSTYYNPPRTRVWCAIIPFVYP